MDEALVTSLAMRYGELEGYITALYADTFCAVGYTLTSTQQTELIAMRALDVIPQSPFLFSEPTPIDMNFQVDYLFDDSNMPDDAGRLDFPQTLIKEKK